MFLFSVLESAESPTSGSSTQPDVSEGSNDVTAYVVVVVVLVAVLVIGGLLFVLLLFHRSRKQRGSLELRSDTAYTGTLLCSMSTSLILYFTL